jgi:hypothetical protein
LTNYSSDCIFKIENKSLNESKMNKRITMLLRHNLVGQIGAALLSLFVIFSVVGAVTTISSNISTQGTLTVTGVSQFNGSVQATSTVLITDTLTTYGDAVFGNAATDINYFTGQLMASTTSLFTTGLVTYADSTFGNAATDINYFTGQLMASTTSLFTTGLTAYGNIVLQNAEAIGNATDGNIFLQGTTVSIATSTASTTAGALWVAAPATTATTTVQINGNRNGEAGAATAGSCIQMWQENLAFRAYISATSTDLGYYLRVEQGSCND